METTIILFLFIIAPRFDPTYKGWKLQFLVVCLNLIIFALILPTRDGNLELFRLYQFSWVSFDPTYKGWKH